MIGTIGGAAERGKLRRWKHAAASRYQLLRDQLLRDPGMKRQVDEFAMRGSAKGRQRAFRRINGLVSRFGVLQDVQLSGPAPLALWAALRPRGHVLSCPKTEGEKQDCVTANYVLAGAIDGPGRGGRGITGLWSVEVPDHALLRVLQRNPGADLTAVLLDAHRAVLRLPTDDIVRRAFLDIASRDEPTPGFLMAAGGGVFICEFHFARAASNKEYMIGVRAVTWLHNDQLRDDQRPEPEGVPDQRLGDGILLPLPLRQTTDEEGLFPGWVGSFGQPRNG
jgi:hypothetical protein